MKSIPFALAWALVFCCPAAAEGSDGPQPLPASAPAATPRDVAYPGVVRLSVDATDIERRIMRVRETIPVAAAGPVTLLYPAWIPGKHGPVGQIEKLAGLVIRAGGQIVPWRRDPLDVFAFHLDAPAGATELEVEFQYVSPTAADQGRVVMTPEMLNLQWFSVALYPAGYFVRQIPVEASVRLPSGWSFATALETVGRDDGAVRFRQTTFETLVDSPIFAGLHYRQVDLDPGASAPVRLNLFADRPDLLVASSDEIERHRELVRQSYRLFGSRHYDHYDFLVALTERLGGIGVEHHRSTEIATGSGYFSDWAGTASVRDLLPHEFIHSWNGKFRRPADLWSANYNVPMRDSLLWVYEGQTQYWGNVLAGRSGLVSRQEALDALALTAAIYEIRVGRQWRTIQDTTNDPIIAERRPQPWISWQRSEDYYSEGQLVWLDADTLIREQSAGRRSLDDFARAFFGVNDGSWTPVVYNFDDVVAALNRVQPYDWAGFLRARIDQLAIRPPLDGLARGGWRLVYTNEPTGYFKSVEARRRSVDLTWSLGLTLGKDGEITAVQWDGPAFKAGLTVGVRLIAVNGVAYDPERLRDAVVAARTGPSVSLIVRSGDQYRTVAIDWRGGLRYPRLERIPGVPDRLSAIYAPRS